MINKIDQIEKELLDAYMKINKDNHNVKIIKLKSMLNKCLDLANNFETEKAVLLN